MFEIVQKPQISQIKCVILDYDGTLTTFRRGWEKILYNYAFEKICEGKQFSTSKRTILESDVNKFVNAAGGSSPR